MDGALQGIRVLDVTYYVPGPYAGMRLAEMGAEVIKVEPPTGDPARYMSGGHVHTANNKGKTIVHLDLKSAEGRRQMLELAKEADALIETFRPGVMRKLGLDYKTLCQINPGLVYCSLSGYGQDGPLAHLGSHDLNYLALSGALDQMADASGKPIHPTNTFADYTGGLLASEKIIAALFGRIRTGKGVHLDIALAEAMAEFQGNHDIYFEKGVSENGVPEISGAILNYAIYGTKDGRYVTLGALEEKFWHQFCDFAGKPEWEAWYGKAQGTAEHAEVATYFKTKNWQEWYRLSLEIDCCLAPVLKGFERHAHPFFRQRSASINSAL
ncbi:CaiB/BaiF CoA transferase family protein [Planococcus massiliensis]|uniref:CaiB/BaiF CoA transferase family protein n=1 Tax=Planococcus massiliensis TaxID=1499687 RepID=UPI000697C028|nr:CoA transferase [Planococcus massiliensis]